jgi:endonuclease YncB( thermonuclease family)
MIKTNVFSPLIFAFFVLNQYPIQAQNYPSASVVSIGDGDTLRVDQSGQKLTIRLGCIDAV